MSTASTNTKRGNLKSNFHHKNVELNFIIFFFPLNSAKNKTNIKILDEIQSGDPIGLHVYLTEKNV